MARSLWFIEVVSERPRDPAVQWPDRKQIVAQASRRGVGIHLLPNRVEASFNVTADDVDAALDRARGRWSSLVSDLGLPNWDVVRLSIDRSGPHTPDSGRAARQAPVPWTKPGATIARFPERNLRASIFDLGASEDHRTPPRMRALSRSMP